MASESRHLSLGSSNSKIRVFLAKKWGCFVQSMLLSGSIIAQITESAVVWSALIRLLVQCAPFGWPWFLFQAVSLISVSSQRPFSRSKSTQSFLSSVRSTSAFLPAPNSSASPLLPSERLGQPSSAPVGDWTTQSAVQSALYALFRKTVCGVSLNPDRAAQAPLPTVPRRVRWIVLPCVNAHYRFSP